MVCTISEATHTHPRFPQCGRAGRIACRPGSAQKIITAGLVLCSLVGLVLFQKQGTNQEEPVTSTPSIDTMTTLGDSIQEATVTVATATGPEAIEAAWAWLLHHANKNSLVV